MEPQVVFAVVAPVVAFVGGLVVDYRFNVVLRVVAKWTEARQGFAAAVAKAEAKVEAVRNAIL